MQPFYFGTSERPLFGIYEAPDQRRGVRGGVVICAPLGHEYIRAYRALRNLGVQVAASGFHVLRFDYYGAGDSSGSSDEMTVAECVVNISSAFEELKDIAGLRRINVMGLRFGATLAARAICDRTDVERFTVWDPVVSGAEYLARLGVLQAEWITTRPQLRHARLGTPPSEILGFPLSDAFRQEIASLDLASIDLGRIAKVSAVVSTADPHTAAWTERLQTTRTVVSLREVPGGGEWERPEAVHSALIVSPDQMQQLVAAARGEPA
jgi:pimeloyl-ACP methyl ester carboxylesterase